MPIDDTLCLLSHAHSPNRTKLADTSYPLVYTSSDGRFTYLATLCGASRVLAESCKADDAVAGIRSSCEFYGRATAEGKWQLIDNDHPDKGVKVTYGSGSRCQAPLSPYYSVTFNMMCDPNAIEPLKALFSVDEEPNTCHYIYSFRYDYSCMHTPINPPSYLSIHLSTQSSTLPLSRQPSLPSSICCPCVLFYQPLTNPSLSMYVNLYESYL